MRLLLVLRLKLIKVLSWLLVKLEPTKPQLDSTLLAATYEVVSNLEKEQTKHTGHFKRAMAMKALYHKFPYNKRRDVALAIELSVRFIK
jgi:hypothetical protein